MRNVLLVAASLAALATATSGQTTHPVTLAGFSFSPANLTINVGDTVQWNWVNGTHNVVSGSFGVADGNFTSGAATPPPNTFSITFDAAYLATNPMPGNVYPYYCQPHVAFGMVGNVTVNAGIPPAFSNYGCGRNPSNSLVLLSGNPQVGQNFTVGVDNPLGTQPAGSVALVAVAVAPDPNFPCGTPLPGFGMSGPGQLGELLISLTPPNPLLTLGPVVWGGQGSPAGISIPIPPDPSLAGLDLFLQGAIVDISFTSGIPIGLTEGAKATIGS